MTTPNHLIFGKDQTARVVGVEPGTGDKCVLFVQNEAGDISQLEAPLSHWLIYTEKLSPKMQELAGNQPYKYIIEYDNRAKFEQVLAASKKQKMDTYPSLWFDGNVSLPANEAFMIKSGVTCYKEMKISEVAVLSFDLEHTFGIGDTLDPKGKLLIISNTFRNSKGVITKKAFFFDEYSSEPEMLKAWAQWVRVMDPSILTGHNIFGHDFKVLRYAFKRANVKMALGRDGSEMTFNRKPSKFRKDGQQSYEYFDGHIYGRDVVDGFFLALKYDVKRIYESYGLKQLIKQSGLEKAHRAHYDASEIWKKYKDPIEWAKIKAYAIDDADDSLAIFDKMAPAFFYTVQNIPMSFQQVINTASGRQINSMMVRSYLQIGHSIAKPDPKKKFRGALSFGIPGLHKNVFKADIQSEHPSLILEFKIQNAKKDPLGHFLKMVEYYRNARIEVKKKAAETGDIALKNLDDAFKVFLNSFFGFLGAKGNYNFPDGAELICRLSRELLIKAVEIVTGRKFEAAAYNVKEETVEIEEDDAA